MLELLAAEMRIAELEKALEKAADAYLDPLTGALSRRGFDKACQRELSRISARQRITPLPISIWTISKKLNDTRPSCGRSGAGTSGQPAASINASV